MEPQEREKRALSQENAEPPSSEALWYLTERLRRVEGLVGEHDARHTRYMDSVTQLRTHFDGELAAIKVTHQALIATVNEVRTIVSQLNNLLRQDDNGMSLLAWRHTMDVWADNHSKLHKDAQNRTWEVGLKVILWLLAGAVAALAARLGIAGKL